MDSQAPDPQSPIPDPGHTPWWMSKVIYQIYPRSFQDSNDDGIGDLPGIISRLDYLQELGVGGIWLSPIFSSPQRDFGYDVSDYMGINPEYGTMDDFKALLDEARIRDIKIIMDLALNHTSDEHPWFQEAAASRESKKHDWYIWREGIKSQPPTNWKSVFGGSSWQWHEGLGQHYLHSFLKEQPDVNWRNPKLREAMWDVIRFWLDLGVDGFRLDVANCFVKDSRFRDNPRKYRGVRPYDWQRHIYDRDRPEAIKIMGEIRKLVDQYPERMTVGEVMVDGPGDPQLAADYCDRGEGLHMAFNFAFTSCPWRARSFAEAVDRWEVLLGEEVWPNYVLNNHDRARSISRYSRGRIGQEEAIPRAKVAAAMLLTLRGTPFLYYGEEIGMSDGRIPRGQLRDPVGKRYWSLHPGRDPVRTPMQWDSSANAGFSPSKPWLPVNKNYLTTNVSIESLNPQSLLNWYRALIRLRQSEPALQSGAYRRVETGSGLFCYERTFGDDRILVALNFTGKDKTIALPAGGVWRTLLCENLSPTTPVSSTADLPPYGVLIAKAADK